MPYVLLAFAIVAEVVGTTALKASDGFTRLLPSLVVVSGYGLAFFLLSLSLRTFPLGFAYAVWSALGIVLAALAGVLIYGEKLDVAGVVGVGLIVGGVVILNVFSKAAGH